MSERKIFIFSPVAEARESNLQLEAAGFRLVLGDASWATPMGNNEDPMCTMARGCVALMDASLRSSPITRRIMESAGPGLLVVSKYTVGVDDVDVDAATELGILVTHGPTEANWGGVAEGTITAMLTLLKKVRERDHTSRPPRDGETCSFRGRTLVPAHRTAIRVSRSESSASAESAAALPSSCASGG